MCVKLVMLEAFTERERILWKPAILRKLWKLQSRPLDGHPMDRGGGGTILQITVRN